jgi:hypothetical protein
VISCRLLCGPSKFRPVCPSGVNSGPSGGIRRLGSLTAPRSRPSRAWRRPKFFSRRREPRRNAGSRGTLRLMSHECRRCGVRWRVRRSHTVRNHLWNQNHPGPGNRNWALVARSV